MKRIRLLKRFWNTPPEGRYLNLKEITAFGVYSTGCGLIYSAVTTYVVSVTYIPYFYNIKSIHAYLILIIGYILNMFLQPIIGNLMERTNTKWGRYKPFILLSLPIFSVFALMSMWIPQYSMEKSRVIFAYISCVPVITLSTFFNNMYQTMPNVITPNTQERTDLMTPIGLLHGVAPSLMNIVAGPIRAAYIAKGMEYMGMRIIGIVSVGISIVCVLCILKVKERVYSFGIEEEKMGIRKALRMLKSNKPLWVLFAALLVGSLREFWRVFLIFMVQFRFADNVQTALNISGIPLSIVSFGSTIAMLLLPIFSRKTSKNRIICYFSMIGGVCLLALGIVGFERIPQGFISATVITIVFFLASVTPITLLIPVMLGEIADLQQLTAGKRLEGYLQNLLFSIPLLVSQVLMLGAWVWQNAIGFEPKDYAKNEVLTETQQHIANKWFDAVCIISAVSTFLMIIVLWFYPLTKKKVESLSAALREKAMNKQI